MAAISKGKMKEAAELLKHAMILHAEPWLLQKAKRRLQECDNQQSRR
jgi:hypothetical protein